MRKYRLSGIGSAPLAEAEHLAGEGLPGVEVGAGDARVAHALDVDGHRFPGSLHVPGQEGRGDLAELVGRLDLGPVPTVGEDVQLAFRIVLRATNAPSSGFTRSSRPQVSSVCWRSWCASRQSRPSSKLFGVPERHPHRGHRLLGTGRGRVGEPLLDELVGDEVLVDHHGRDEGAQPLASGIAGEVHQPLDALGRVGVEKVERGTTRPHQHEPADPLGVGQREPHRRTAAEAVA